MGAPPRPADDRQDNMTTHRDFVHGVDDWAQQRVAAQMRRRAAAAAPDYILNVGDNFYWAGIEVHCGVPPRSVHDYTGQWREIFENIYFGPGIDGKPWLGVLGNHDYGGYIFHSGWDSTIGYTWVTGPPSTGRWLTPAQYWRTTARYPGFHVDYFFVDSNTFGAAASVADPEHNICSEQHNTKHGSQSCGVQGPSSTQDCPGWFSRLWEEQLDWMDEGLSHSDADWQVVVTHYPPEWGTATWASMSAKHGIDLIITGHVHSQGVHYLEPGNAMGPTAYIVSGGGGGITSGLPPHPEGEDDAYGFMDLTLSREEIKIEAISHAGIRRSVTCVRQRPRSGMPPPGVTARSLCDAPEEEQHV
mmetsp:Transcript_27005/g.76629  ORF Transcript_27005/g.76629 Transcript_27005/m.76629 type:complete len:359 (+) Transcript_27005:2313-3389(+)